MTIELNGQPIEVPEDASVASLVERAGGGERRAGVAVAVDGEVVPQSRWEDTILADGQRIEVVGAIQGG